MKVIQRQSTALKNSRNCYTSYHTQYDTSTIRVLQRNDVKGPVKMAHSMSANGEKFH